MIPTPRSLSSYRPQHDERCEIHKCRECGHWRGDPTMHGYGDKCDEWHSLPCSCGLDALLAAEGQDEMQKNDHGAGLAAAQTIPDVAERVPASGNDCEHGHFGGCGRPDCSLTIPIESSPTETASDLLRREAEWMQRFHDEKERADHLRGSICAILSYTGNRAHAIPLLCKNALDLDNRLQKALAGNQAATEVSSTPAASPALKAQTHVDLADAGSETLPISEEDRADALSLAIFVGRQGVPLDNASLSACREYIEARELLRLPPLPSPSEPPS